MGISRKSIVAGLLMCLAALLPVAVFYSRPHPPNEIVMSSDTKFMEQEVAKQIPIGSNIRKAKQIMEQNGFGCSVVINGTVVRNRSLEQAGNSGKKVALSCTKKTGPFVTNTWIIDLGYKGSRINNISVYFRSTASDL